MMESFSKSDSTMSSVSVVASAVEISMHFYAFLCVVAVVWSSAGESCFKVAVLSHWPSPRTSTKFCKDSMSKAN